MMKITSRLAGNRILSVSLATLLVSAGCATAHKRITWREDKHSGRKIASISGDDSGSVFDQTLMDLGVRAYSANLHSHHFMEYKPGKKAKHKDEFLGPGACEIRGSMPQDDGKPCRNTEEGEDSFVMPPTKDRLDYFRMACEYGHEQGELDVLFVTPHTKDGKVQSDTSTLREGLEARHKLLKEINAKYGGKFYCGLGQEASSISTGNHMNLLGHFGQDKSEIDPFFFEAGAFDQLYPQIKARLSSDEPIIAQLNHPDVQRDLWWGDFSKVSRKKKKELLNDYGIDDYAPVGCLRNPESVPGCDSEPPKKLTHEMLKATFAKIREASGDPFRLIEVISPGGATDNPTTGFRPVQHRLDEKGLPTEEMDRVNQGLYDYVFYLAMGMRLGPTADQDNHHANWGTATASRTGILAAALDESDIVGALQARRTFASEDKNAKMVFYSEEKHEDHELYSVMMGGELTAAEETLPLMVGYQDPDDKDHAASVRFYYYRESDSLDFNHFSDPKNVFRLVSFKDGNPVLPKGASSAFSQIPTERDSISIESGKVVRLELPVEPGLQYVFVEITQTGDNDKVYSAPIWIRR